MGAYKLSLHCVGAANNVLALKHVHQECQRVHNDAVWWVGVFRIHGPVKSLNHFPGISDTEVLELVAEGQFLRIVQRGSLTLSRSMTCSLRFHVRPDYIFTLFLGCPPLRATWPYSLAG